jgi:hypothetical protein
MDDDDTWSSITVREGSVQHLDFLSDDEKDTFKTAFEIDQRWVIDHAGDRAEYHLPVPVAERVSCRLTWRKRRFARCSLAVPGKGREEPLLLPLEIGCSAPKAMRACRLRVPQRPRQRAGWDCRLMAPFSRCRWPRRMKTITIMKNA